MEQLVGLRWKQFFQPVVKPQRHICVLTGIFIDGRRFQVGHRFLSLSFRANQFLNVNGTVTKQHFGHVIHIMPLLGLHDIVRQHGVINRASDFHAVVREHHDVVFKVLPHFERTLVLVDRTEAVDDSLRQNFITRHGNVPGLAFGYCKTHSD